MTESRSRSGTTGSLGAEIESKIESKTELLSSNLTASEYMSKRRSLGRGPTPGRSESAGQDGARAAAMPTRRYGRRPPGAGSRPRLAGPGACKARGSKSGSLHWQASRPARPGGRVISHEAAAAGPGEPARPRSLPG